MLSQAAIDALAKKFIQSSCTKPSDQFGATVLEVDHVVLGKLARQHRENAKIKAVRVADALSLSKCRLTFLETGNKRWTTDLLRNYLAAIEKLKKKEKAKINVLS